MEQNQYMEGRAMTNHWDYGAVSGSKWLQLQWPAIVMDLPISVKELIPVIVAAALWDISGRMA